MAIDDGGNYSCGEDEFYFQMSHFNVNDSKGRNFPIIRMLVSGKLPHNISHPIKHLSVFCFVFCFTPYVIQPKMRT